MEGFNQDQFEAARRAWEASAAEGIDPVTRKALERLSAKCFWGSLGMGGEHTRESAHSPFAGVTRLTR